MSIQITDLNFGWILHKIFFNYFLFGSNLVDPEFVEF